MDEQLSIFNLIDLSNDPLYLQIHTLNIGECVQIGNLTVTRTSRFLEVLNNEFHECFTSAYECYHYIDKLM